MHMSNMYSKTEYPSSS